MEALQDQDGRFLNVYELPLNDIWNSDSMRNIRRAMVHGEVLPDCENTCISKEKAGSLTRRLWENRQWEIGYVAKEGVSITDLKADAVRNNFSVKYPPFAYALTPNNLCNLACRMCSANFSSRVENDSVHSRWARRTIPSTELLSSRFPGKHHWIQEDDFLFGELFTNNVQLQNVSFSGGEALINPNVLSTIKYLSTHGDPKKLIIYIATNGTIYDDEVFDLAKYFKLMNLGVSIDAIENGNEYIRYGTNWQVMKNNLLRMASLANVSLRVTSTIQAYNVLEFSKLLRFCDKHKMINFSNFVNYPDYLSINVLPPSILSIAAQRLKAYAAVEDGVPINKQRASVLARAFESSKLPFDPQKLHKFMLFTNDLDRSRGQNIRETFPELVQLIAEAGYPWIDETLYWESL